MKTKNIFETLNDIDDKGVEFKPLEDEDDFDDPDLQVLDDNSIAIADEIYKLIQNLIIDDDGLEEEFISTNALNRHYKKHCIDGNNKKSTRTNIYYDFTVRDKYRNYGDDICDKLSNTKNKII